MNKKDLFTLAIAINGDGNPADGMVALDALVCSEPLIPEAARTAVADLLLKAMYCQAAVDRRLHGKEEAGERWQ